MKFVSVTEQNLQSLKDFVDNLGQAERTFRYFKKRPINIVSGHLVTILLEESEKVIGYGHLEREENDVWLGICVLPEFKGKGFGKLIMEELILRAKQQHIKKISLTVDNTNYGGIRLYISFGFELIQKEETYNKYVLVLE